MKINVLSRSDAQWSGRNDGTPNFARGSKNTAPALHPPQRPLDLQRAITAAKIGRTLARPFLFSCTPSHADGVYTLARSHADLTLFASASADGEVRLWHLPSHSCRFHLTPSPPAFIRGITFSSDSQRLLFCSDAKRVYSANLSADYAANPDLVKTLKTYACNAGSPASISSRRDSPHFATASTCVQVWDENRSSPLSSYTVSADSVHCVRYNPVEPNVIVSASSDRSVVFYDVRASTFVRRLVLSHRTNDISWNPMEVMNFAIANDDHNAYIYDMRKLSGRGAVCIHQDHTAAVMTVDYSPTGQEIVTGSYDKTIRIFPHGSGRSREVYHTRRMQRVFAVKYSMDAAYVVSGSDDGDVRVWKSERSRPLKPMFYGEREKVKTSEKLIARYRHVDEVRKIAMKRFVPAHVKHMQATKKIMKESRDRKEKNAQRYVRPENRKPKVPSRKKNIVRELE